MLSPTTDQVSQLTNLLLRRVQEVVVVRVCIPVAGGGAGGVWGAVPLFLRQVK